MKSIIRIRQASLSVLAILLFGTSCAARLSAPPVSKRDIDARSIAAWKEMCEIASLQSDIDRMTRRLQAALGADRVAAALERARAAGVSPKQREASIRCLEFALQQERLVKEAELRALDRLLLVGGGGL